MQIRFRTNLGRIDIDAVKKQTGVALKIEDCLIGGEIDTDEKAAEWLVKRGIAEPTDRIKGVAKKPELVAPSKQP